MSGRYTHLDDSPFNDDLHDPHEPHDPHDMDPRYRISSPSHPLDGAFRATQMPGFPENDRMSAQPTYSVNNLRHSYTNDNAPVAPENYAHPAGGLFPEDLRDEYRADPYRVQSGEAYPMDTYVGFQNDDPHHPMLNPTAVPTPLSMPAAGEHYTSPVSSPVSGVARRWKTVKKVALYKGNLVLDCPVPKKLLQMLPRKDEREFTHMRYSAATCDPSKFSTDRFTLRQQLFQKPRHTELFIVVTMYNEDDVLFARTMAGVFKNIHYLCTRTRSNTWGVDAWKKVVVCVVSDGRGKINPRTRSVLAGMGCYQEGIAKTEVNEKEVTAHIYEYTSQVGIEVDHDLVKLTPGGKNTTPVQMLFCLKEHNAKKINSHRWFFQAFGPVLRPNVCVLIDAGTKPGGTSIYSLWKAFEVNPQCAGACGEIKAMLGSAGRKLINPLVATQNFEYKMSNILDKPLESVFGFISVLPGAFSAYRYVALQNDANDEGPLEKYFKGEKMHGSDAGIFTANMYLAEDRILCFELVTKRNCHWVLQYVKSSEAETDVPEEISELISQRRRWLNGSFFAAIYALVHCFDIWRSDHSLGRKLAFHVEFLYQTISMLFSWFAIGNFFLVFRILTVGLAARDILGNAGEILSVVFEWIYLGVLVTCFILSLGNTPAGSKKFYLAVVIWWAIIMVYLLFAAIFISVKAVQKEIREDANGVTVRDVFSNQVFRNLIVSLASTYVVYFIASFLFLEPWHMFTSFLQYLLLSPTYINVLNVYAFCNVHDVTWGTKGPDVPPPLKNGIVKSTDGKADMHLPTDDKDLDEQYELEMRNISVKAVAEEKMISPEDRQKNFYSGVRSGVVLVWIFTNFALSAAVLNSGGLDRLVSVNSKEDAQTIENSRSQIYLGVILWTVAALSLFRFMGACWFLVIRLFRGV